jgi:hypothetical protein
VVENIVLGVILLGLGILVYYTYNSINKTEKAKQEQLDKEIAAEWEELEAELAMEE